MAANLPEITGAELAGFAVMMVVSLILAFAMAPKRRRVIGNVRYLAASALIASAPLFGAICVRGGYALRYREGGMNPVEAQFLGSLWALGFIILARILMLLFPPSAWLLREWRRAHREASLVRALLRPGSKAA